MPCLEIFWPKHWTDVHLEWHLSVWSFRFCFLQIWRTLHYALSSSAPLMLLSTIKISSAISNIFGRTLNSLSIFLWNVLPNEAAQNVSHLYMYLPKWHENVFRYSHLSSSLRLWYLELASIRVKYFEFINLWNISFNVGPLWIGLISTWFILAELRHSLNFPFRFVTSMGLLDHFAVWSIASGVITPSCQRCSNSSLNVFYSSYTPCLGSAWYALLLALTSSEDVAS